jgi:hypothetical protein
VALRLFSLVFLGIILIMSGCVQSSGKDITMGDPPLREDNVLITKSLEKELEDWKVTMSLVKHNELGLGYSYEVLYKGVETIEDISVHFLGRKGSTGKLSTGQALGGTIYSIKETQTEVEVIINWDDNKSDAIIFALE